MADEIGTGHFKVKLTQLDEEVAAIRAELTKRLEAASAAGEEALVERYRAQLANPQLGGTGTAEIRQATEALREQGGQIERNAQLNLFNLEVLERQARTQAALTAERQAALAGQLEMLPVQGRPGLVTPRGYVPGAEQTARTEALRIEQEQAVADAARLQVLRQQLVTYSEQHVAAQQLAETQAYVTRLAQAEGAGHAEALRIQEEQTAADAARVQQMIRYQAAGTAYQAGVGAAQRGRSIAPGQMERIVAAPAGAEGWTAADAALMRYNAELGRFNTYATRASLESGTMSANFTRLGVAEAEASTALRRHGALTTEFLTALVRGETTLNEFGYQLTATIGKFAGWTVAAGLTYGALGALFEFGKGAIDTASGVQQLTRTIDNLDRSAASKAIVGLSQGTNVSTKEASDAMFQFSRTFHNVAEAAGSAKLGLAAFKLDQSQMIDSVKFQTEMETQLNYTLAQRSQVYDMLSAGQREYNARMQQTIPLIARSLGAVNNAGGDPTQLAQLAIYSQRTYPTIGGTQIGTGFYRSAATFLNPNTPKGRTDRATLQGLGIDPNQGWTEVLHDALVKAMTLGPGDRQKVSSAVFGPLYGARLSGLFNPTAIQEYLKITGEAPASGGQRAITPASTRGSLQQELDRELGTTRERMHSFVNEMQRMGVAIANTGIVPIFNGLITVLVGVGHGIRELAEIFQVIPQDIRPIVTSLLLLRGAMLFLNRTRFGSSGGVISRVARIPGIDPSYEAQSDRAILARGTRSAMTAVEKEIEANTNAALANAARQQTLEAKRAVVQRQIAAGEGDVTRQLALSNDYNTEIVSLQRKQVAIETEKAAQTATLARLTQQQVALTTSNRARRMSDSEVIALKGRVTGTVPAVAATEVSTAAAEEDAAAQQRLAAWRTRAGRALILDADAMRAQAVAAGEQAAAAQVATVSAEESVVAGAGRMSRLAGSLGGLASAIDPLMVAIIAVPWAMGQIQKEQAKYDDQVKMLQGITTQKPTNAGGQKILAAIRSGELDPEAFLKYRTQINRYFALLSAQDNLWVQQGGLHQALSTALTNSVARIADVISKTSLATTGGKDFLKTLDALTPKQLEQKVQTFSSRSDIFGAGTQDTSRAAATFMFMAGRVRNRTDPNELQKLSQAQQAYTSAINRDVQDMVQAAGTSSTSAGQTRGYANAVAWINHQQTAAESWAKQMKQRWGYIKGFSTAVDAALKNIESTLRQQMESVMQDQIQSIEANAAFKASQITGNSPQALIARAETELAGLQQAYAKAKAEHASWKILGDLLTQINTKANDIAQQKIDNARAILEAQGQLASSQIMGTGSGADIARAQQDIANAARILAFDQKNSPNDPAKIAQDQAALNNAYKALNDARQSALKQAHQDLQALIQSQVDLQKSQTSDPLKQDREQLAGDIKLLNALSPSDFQSQSQYQAARNQALAKINTDRTKTHDDIVSADMRNLAFEHDIHKIGDQAYIDGLRKILRDKKLATETRQQILEEIYNLQHQTGNLDLNVGSIKLPSIYQIRRAIGLGKKGEVPGAQNTVVNHSAVVNVYVTGAKGAQAVGRVLDDHLNTSVRSAMRAKGVI